MFPPIEGSSEERGSAAEIRENFAKLSPGQQKKVQQIIGDLNLQDLPDDVLLTIFSHLSKRDLQSLALVNKPLEKLAEETLWEKRAELLGIELDHQKPLEAQVKPRYEAAVSELKALYPPFFDCFEADYLLQLPRWNIDELLQQFGSRKGGDFIYEFFTLGEEFSNPSLFFSKEGCAGLVCRFEGDNRGEKAMVDFAIVIYPPGEETAELSNRMRVWSLRAGATDPTDYLDREEREKKEAMELLREFAPLLTGAKESLVGDSGEIIRLSKRP